MEISGYPHYENVCSNILKFFFNSDEAHQMNDLFIKALLNTVGEKVEHSIIVNDVIREEITSFGNRLDIVILTDDFVIGIENKIYAGLYNNFDDYSNHLVKIASGRKIIRIILSINKLIQNTEDFINITHSDLFNAVDNLIGIYWQHANPKYLILLKDFMQTIRRLGVPTVMDAGYMDFFKDNQEDVEELLRVIVELRKELRQKVQDLGSNILYKNDQCRQWFYRENYNLFDDLVHDITINDAIVAIDTTYSPSGWKIDIWLRKPGKKMLTNKYDLGIWLESKGISKTAIQGNDKSRAVFHKELNKMEDTAIYLQDLVNKLCN
jgi:hypothetical protein